MSDSVKASVYDSFFESLIPKEFRDDFVLEEYEERAGYIRLHLLEKADNYKKINELKDLPYEDICLNGTTSPKEIQTFPINGKETFLYVRRRRWKRRLDTGAQGQGDVTSKDYRNSFSYMNTPIKATKEFALFLKECHRGEDDFYW